MSDVLTKALSETILVTNEAPNLTNQDSNATQTQSTQMKTGSKNQQPLPPQTNGNNKNKT